MPHEVTKIFLKYYFFLKGISTWTFTKDSVKSSSHRASLRPKQLKAEAVKNKLRNIFSVVSTWSWKPVHHWKSGSLTCEKNAETEGQLVI